MADNTTLNTMTGGDVYRSLDRSSVKTTIVALDLNPGGAESLMAGSMPVTISSVPSHAVTNAGTFAVQATVAAGATTIGKAEDVASADADVGVPSMAVRKATPANTSNADGDYEFLQMSVGRLWCSATIDAALPAGTNAIGKLAANSGVTIGAVEIAASQTLSTVTTVSTVSTITNVVHVDDNSGTLTVDAPVGTPVFVRLSDGSSAITTLPVSLASVPSHAVTNAGTFATQESQILADNAGFTDGTTKVFAVGYIYDEVAGTALTENDIGAARMNVNRAAVSCIEDGSTRARYATVTASNALKVDGSAVTQPVSGSLTTVSTVTSVTQFNGVAIALNNGTTSTGTLRVTLSSDSTGIIASIGTSVTPGTSAGHLGKAEDAVAGSGDTGVAVWGVRRDTPATNVNNAGDYAEIPVSGQGTLWVSQSPAVGGGWSISRLLSAATTNATNAKASAGIVGGWYAYNANASVRYLKLYNKATSPTVGSDTPVMTIPIPAGAAANVEFGNGINFATGIGYATTTGVADADTGAVAANEIIINLFYK